MPCKPNQFVARL